MKTKIRNLLLLGTAFFMIFTASVYPDLRITPEATNKVTVNGYCYVVLYLNGYIELSRSGTPLAGQGVYMNNLRLNNSGSGNYIGAINSSAYVPAVGKVITIKLKPRAGRIFAPTKKLILKEVLLGKYTINGYVKWTNPLPGSVISLKSRETFNTGRTLKFTWDHFGRSFRARVKIRDMATNNEIFNQTISASAEEISVPSILFKKGGRYQFDVGSKNVMGKFKLTKAVTKGSKIEFYYNDVIYVNAR